MGYKLKWRFLVKLTIVLLLAAVAIHFTHRWQVRSQVGAFLDRADRARDAAKLAEEKKPPEPQVARAERESEQKFLQRYILARPNDIEVRDRLARLMCKNARTNGQKFNAYFVLEDVLRRDPERDDLRRFAIDFVMSSRLALLSETKANLKDEKHGLMRKKPSDGELKGIYARCLAAERNFTDAEKNFKYATDYLDEGEEKKDWPWPPPDPETITVESFAGLALVKRELNKPGEANRVIHVMLAKKSEDFRAYLYAVVLLRELGLDTLPETVLKGNKISARSLESLVNDAYGLKPEDLDVLIAKADLARSQARKLRTDPKPESSALAKRKTEEARLRLNEAIKLHPLAESAYLAMAQLEAEDRQLDDAIKVVRVGLAKDELKDSVKLMRGLLEYQFLAEDVKGAAETLKELQARGLESGQDDFATARVLMLEDKWKEAAVALERAIPQLHDDSSSVREAHILLGRCYEQLGEHERRLREYTLALPNEVATPLWASAMIGIAESEAALGRIDDALKSYRKMTDFFPAMWERVARLELIRALRSTTQKADLSEVEKALTQAGKYADDARFFRDPTDLRILEATVKHYRGNAQVARNELENLRAEKPKNAAVRIELAMQALREGTDKYPEALKLLDEAVKEIGDSADLRLARARVWAAMNVKDLSSILTDLATKTESLSPSGTTPAAAVAQKRRLLRGLAEIASASGADEAATKLWDKLGDEKPFDLSVQLVRFDRALRAGDLKAMRAIVPKIDQLDGENGRSARLARALLLIQQSQAPDNRELRNQALHLLEAIEREQEGSTSGRILLAQALIHDLNGSTEAAKPKYRQAIERGELNPQAIRRFIEILGSGDAEERKEASALIAKLQTAPELGPDFLRMAAGISLQTNDLGQAMRIVGSMKEDSTNYKDQILLGHVYWANKQANPTDKSLKDPGPRFEKATELAPKAMETWRARMQYLLATGNKDKAAGVFEEARKNVDPADLPLFTAFGYVQLGDTKKAIETLEQARKERPSDVRILRGEADLLFQTGQLKEAREGYQRVIDSSSALDQEREAARQGFALATAADPAYQTAKQALALKPLTGKETPAQLRAHAVILGLQKDIGHRKEAIRLLEENRKGSNVGERFLLAQLHNLVGNRTGAQLVMEEILHNESNRTPLHLRFYARWLIREGELSRASNWIDLLAKKDPDSLATAELKARLAAARKDLRGAWEALRLKAEKPETIAVIAGICEDIGLHEDAERLIKQLVEKNKEAQPRVILGLAAFYGRRGRTAEGLQICEEMRGKLPLAMVAEAAISVLYNAPTPSKADMEKVAGWLVAASQKATGPERAALLQSLAAIRNLQALYADAAAIYREILTANPNDALALNNLAYLISAVDKRDADIQMRQPDLKIQSEALAMINQAKQIMGPHPVLLDTEALIWLNFNQPEKALPLMQDVVAQEPSGSAYFHLARVEKALKHDIEAQVAWGEARERGLKLGDLHPLEREAYDTIMKELK